MPTRTPENSPRPAEEHAVIAALANAGIRVSFVGVSKFDWILGDAARRSGIFTGTIDGIQTRADVLFLDVPANEVTVCTEEAPGETKFIERFFAMSTNVRVRDALRDALGLSEPRC